MKTINRYAVMYDQLKAIYGDDLDIMIKVVNDTSYDSIPQLNKRNAHLIAGFPKKWIMAMLSTGLIGSAMLFVLTIGGDIFE
jgi:hypothetical protein